jgi:hypothetical protein
MSFAFIGAPARHHDIGLPVLASQVPVVAPDPSVIVQQCCAPTMQVELPHAIVPPIIPDDVDAELPLPADVVPEVPELVGLVVCVMMHDETSAAPATAPHPAH